MAELTGPAVLCVDEDRDIAEVVQAILTDEGYRVSCLYALSDDALLRAVGRLEPDCILLDGGGPASYDESWRAAASLSRRHRHVPVVMFTAHTKDVTEARMHSSQRAMAAGFAGIVPKPFDLDELLDTVAAAVGQSDRFDRSAAADVERTRELMWALEAHGATAIQPSRMREWANFRDREGRLMQVYWWQARGVYQVGRYADDGTMVMLGQFVDRDAAIELALPSSR